MYSIKDTKVGKYGMPFFKHDRIEAKRELTHAVNGGSEKLELFAEDYDLYEIGTFDQETCQVDIHEPYFIVHLVELRDEKIQAVLKFKEHLKEAHEYFIKNETEPEKEVE